MAKQESAPAVDPLVFSNRLGVYVLAHCEEARTDTHTGQKMYTNHVVRLTPGLNRVRAELWAKVRKSEHLSLARAEGEADVEEYDSPASWLKENRPRARKAHVEETASVDTLKDLLGEFQEDPALTELCEQIVEKIADCEDLQDQRASDRRAQRAHNRGGQRSGRV